MGKREIRRIDKKVRIEENCGGGVTWTNPLNS